MEKSGVRRHGLSAPITICLPSERLDKGDTGGVEREGVNARYFGRLAFFSPTNLAGECAFPRKISQGFQRRLLSQCTRCAISCASAADVIIFVFKINYFLACYTSQRTCTKDGDKYVFKRLAAFFNAILFKRDV